MDSFDFWGKLTVKIRVFSRIYVVSIKILVRVKFPDR